MSNHISIGWFVETMERRQQILNRVVGFTGLIPEKYRFAFGPMSPFIQRMLVCLGVGPLGSAIHPWSHLFGKQPVAGLVDDWKVLDANIPPDLLVEYLGLRDDCGSLVDDIVELYENEVTVS